MKKRIFLNRISLGFIGIVTFALSSCSKAVDVVEPMDKANLRVSIFKVSNENVELANGNYEVVVSGTQKIKKSLQNGVAMFESLSVGNYDVEVFSKDNLWGWNRNLSVNKENNSIEIYLNN